MPNTKDHYNVMLTKKLISFQDLKSVLKAQIHVPTLKKKLWIYKQKQNFWKVVTVHHPEYE